MKIGHKRTNITLRERRTSFAINSLQPARESAGRHDRDQVPDGRAQGLAELQEALLLLGDLLFERGEFRAAEQTWRRLLPDGGADVAYPASRQDQAPVRARVILAAIYQRELDRAVRELAVFRKRHPDSAGAYAGKNGPFAETREQLGGYTLIDAKDLDEAIEIASHMPSGRLGTVEIRPVLEFGQAEAAISK